MTQQQTILELAVPARMWQTFDYLPPVGEFCASDWQPGIRVLAPFGKRSLVGMLVSIKDLTTVSADKLKPALSKIDQFPVLNHAILDLCRWASDYYHYPLGEVIAQALPKSLRQGKDCPEIITQIWEHNTESSTVNLKLNTYQQKAIEAINSTTGFQTYLLDGVTGSGKTEVYFHAIETLLSQGKQILLLVPEIGLTPQTVQRFEQRFKAPVVLLHSEMSDKKKLKNWSMAAQGSAAIVIGTRSAIFTPLLNPGMIILDEEHDLSFKQQSNLRYSARDLAIVRGQMENIPVVLGSATPSLETLQNAKSGKFVYLNLPVRAGDAKPPLINLIDLRDKRLTGGLSRPLIEKMTEHLSKEGQVLLFLNRRGYASLLMCHHCGWMAKCRRCDARLTLHIQPDRLNCHHCGMIKPLPEKCEQCRFPDLIRVGQGTERIEQTIAELFPKHPYIRIDQDTTKKRGTINQLLNEIHQQNAQILIGTQMLAKGHHFEHLTLVVIVDADAGLFSVDFRGLERLAQLLIQVAGRAGRGLLPGEVVIQTHHPDHPHLQMLLKHGYAYFANALLAERRQTSLPPFTYLALLRAESNLRETTQSFLMEAKSSLENGMTPGNINLLGPIPAPMERCAGRFRGQLLLQATKRGDLQEALSLWTPQLSRMKMAAKVRWSLDIDPQELI